MGKKVFTQILISKKGLLVLLLSFSILISGCKANITEAGGAGDSAGGGGSSGESTVDPTLASGTITINSGASYATNTSVTVNLTSSAATVDMYVTNTSGCAAGGAWETKAASKAWTLANSNAGNTVYVKFRNVTLVESACYSAAITHDNTAPSGESISINSGAALTSTNAATLTLAATSATEMYITNIAGCASGSSWEAYGTSKPWTLPTANAANTVYAKFRDAAGNESTCVNDSITHDNTAPSGESISIAAGATYTTTTSETLTLAATGASDMYITNTAGCGSGGAWEAYATSKAWTLPSANASNTVYAKFKDTAGNESTCVNDSITHDNTAPTGHSISIAGGAATTTSTSVTLTLAATGASNMYITDTAGCASGGAWEAYNTSKAWTLPTANAVNTVYSKFKDDAGNETSCVSDAITHDNTAPTGTTISINGGAATTASTSVTLTLAATGASDMYVTNTSGCASGGSYEAYATSKNWTLPNTGAANTIYIKFKDSAGNESACISDDITHVAGPTGESISIAGGAATTTTDAITLTLGATGATEMYITNTSGCSAGGAWEAYNTSKAWTLGQTNATATVYVKYRDGALTETSCVNDTITHDNTAPTGTSISVNSGDAGTNSTAATLTLAATGASDMYITNNIGCGSGGAWESYATTKSWTLPSTNVNNLVYIKYKDAAGNESACIYDDIIHDNTTPTGDSISIAAGATYTTTDSITLTLAATDTNPLQMYITNTAGCGSGGAWEAYATSKAWTLGQTNSTATVYIKYKDIANNETSCINDTIIHDNTAPTGDSISIASGAAYTTTDAITLILAATGASDMYITNTAGCAAGGAWEAYATSKAWTLGQTNNTATVYIKYKDSAGNTSSCINDTIIHDNTTPTGDSISIAAGAAFTTTTSETLTLAASDTNSLQMYITNTAGCGSGGSYEAYSTSKAWTLSSTNATNTVYVKFKDAAGNETSCINDTIIHDNTTPTGHSVSIAAGATYTTTDSITLTLAASDTNSMQMYVTNTAGCASGGSWEAYGTSKAWTLAQLNATATVYAKFKDGAGNETTCVSDTIIHDNTAPAGDTISIAAGASTTTTDSITLTLSATDTYSIQMYVTNTSGCGSGGTYEAYGTSKAWTLGQTNATATVYVKYKDAAGNESACINDTIVHDNTNPSIAITSAPTWVNIANKAAYVASGTCSDAGSGISGNVTVTLTDGTNSKSGTSACSAGTYSVTLNTTTTTPGALVEGSSNITVTASVSDAAGNSSAPSVTRSHDITAPGLVGVTSHNENDLITLSSNVTNSYAITVSGTCEANATINITPGTNASVSTAGTCNGTGDMSSGITLSGNGGGTRTIDYSQTDAAGNTGGSMTRTLKYVPYSLANSVKYAAHVDGPNTNPLMTVANGDTFTVKVVVKDSSSTQTTLGGLTIAFSTSGGTATGTIGAVTDNTNGTYTATFTATGVGTATTLNATINGANTTGTSPTIKVITNPTDASTSANLVAWYNANALAGADASAVSSWTDSGANAFHMDQTVAAYQPQLFNNQINGKKSVRFFRGGNPANGGIGSTCDCVGCVPGGSGGATLLDGTTVNGGTFLTSTAIAVATTGVKEDNIDFTAFYVVKGAIVGDNGGKWNNFVFAFQNASGANGFRAGTNSTAVGCAATTARRNTWRGTNIESAYTAVSNYQNWYISSSTFKYAVTQTTTGWTNGGTSILTGTGGTQLPSVIAQGHLGAQRTSTTAVNGFFDGDMAEVIIYRTLFTDAQRQEIEDYLAAKYAITSSH